VDSATGGRSVASWTVATTLSDPLGRWVLSYAYMRHFAAGMTNHEEDIEGLEENVCTLTKSQAQISAACRWRKRRHRVTALDERAGACIWLQFERDL